MIRQKRHVKPGWWDAEHLANTKERGSAEVRVLCVPLRLSDRVCSSASNKSQRALTPIPEEEPQRRADCALHCATPLPTASHYTSRQRFQRNILFLVKVRGSGIAGGRLAGQGSTTYTKLGAGLGVYSLLLKIAAMTRGLRRPCITATTHNGFSSGA